MESTHLIMEMLVVLGAASVLGLIAHRLGRPAILGYLAAGLILGPGTPGPVVDFQQVEVLAELGVMFLMFSLGVHFSFSELLEFRRVVTRAGGAQVLITLLIAALVCLTIGFGLAESFLIAAVVSISSSTVSLKMLQIGGTLHRPVAQATIGILLAQDLAVVPLLAILPAMNGSTESIGPMLLESVGLAAVVVVAVVLLGLRLVPWFLYQVAQIGSRELFLAAVVVIAFGVATATASAGLSLAFGAFLAGVVVSESEFSQHALGEIAPLSDLFSIIFFASIGLLVNPDAIVDDAPLVLLLLALIIIVKGVISVTSLRLVGYSMATAVAGGLFLTQIGEFSFVLASQGLSLHVIDNGIYNVILASAILSLLVNPLIVNSAERLDSFVSRIRISSSMRHLTEPDIFGPKTPHRGHVVVAGYGRAGRELVRALQRRGFRYVVIDLNPQRVRDLKAQGIEAIYGDIGNREVLRAAGIPGARVFAVTVPDLVSAQEGIRVARMLDANLDIIARAQTHDQAARLDKAGAAEVVQPAFEVGLEFVRHTLHRFGVSLPEIHAVVSARRIDYYTEERIRNEME